MKEKIQSKYIKYGLCIVLSGAALLLLYTVLNNVDAVRGVSRSVFRILSPFVYGLSIAYLLCPVYIFCEKKIRCSFEKKISKKHADRWAKFIATIAILVALLGAVGGLLALILPETIRSTSELVQSLPVKVDILIAWINGFFADSSTPELAQLFEDLVEKSSAAFSAWFNSDLIPNLVNCVSKTFSGAWSTVKTLLNVIIGIFVCVYFLNSKEVFQAQAKKAIIALCGKERSIAVLDFCSFTNLQFASFIRGKLIDSLIIGILCAILMVILRLPYVVLISTIVGITNVIPFFGPFIGAVPGFLILLLENPAQALCFGIMILILQQFDGAVLGPKILGGFSGLSSFWVLFAILTFGGMFGFVGMIIGVPTFAIIHHYFEKYINKKLKDRNLPVNIGVYQTDKTGDPDAPTEETHGRGQNNGSE